MSKSFKEYFAEKFEPIGAAEKKFVAKHTVKQVPDFSGETEGQHKAKTKTYDRSAHRMGYDPGQDVTKYEDWDHGFSDEELDLIVDNMTVEEYEQLDELSKHTLMSYVRKSAEDVKDRKWDFRSGDKPGERRAAGKKINKRLNGMTMAAQKLGGNIHRIRATEETDLQELSRKTLANYIDKAAYSAGSLAHSAGGSSVEASFNGPPYSQRASERAGKAIIKSFSRLRGVTRAANKMAGQKVKVAANEEADLTELSKHTLVSYIHRATADAANSGMKAKSAEHRGDPEGVYKNRDKAIKRVQGTTKAAGRLAYGGGHALSRQQSKSGIAVSEGKTFKDMRKFGDEDRNKMKSRLQARMQARKGEC